MAPLFIITSCDYEALGLTSEENNNVNDDEIIDFSSEEYRSSFNITWMNGDYKVITKTVKRNSIANMDAINKKYKAKLTKKGNDTTLYVFAGWNRVRQENDIGEIETNIMIKEDTVFYAVFQEKQCNINWYNGEQLLYSETATYGTKLNYNAELSSIKEEPIKEGNERVYYTFIDWNTVQQEDDVGEIEENIVATVDLNLHAIFNKAITKVDVTWYNCGTEIYSERINYGEKITYKQNNNSTKDNDSNYVYTFVGWNTKRLPNDVGTALNNETIANISYTDVVDLHAVYS